MIPPLTGLVSEPDSGTRRTTTLSRSPSRTGFGETLTRLATGSAPWAYALLPREKCAEARYRTRARTASAATPKMRWRGRGDSTRFGESIRAALGCKWERTATAFPLLPNYFPFKTILQLSLKNQAIEAHDSSSQTCTTAICWGKASAVRLWIVGRGGADSAAVR